MSQDIADFALTRVALSTGVELDVAMLGPVDGEPLIFLHGFPESHRTWRHQLAHFSDRYRCIAPNQRGYCQSDKPAAVADYSPDKLTADIFALADTLGLDEFTIVGHDWGGAIAWSVALNGDATATSDANRGRVKRTIIANAPHPFIFQRLLIENMEQRASSQYMRGFRDPANDTLIREHGLVGLLLQEVKWDRSAAMSDKERGILIRDWQEPGAAFGMLNWYRAAAIQVPAMDEDMALPAFLNAPFPHLTMPTLVIWATDDLALPPCNLEGLEALVDDLTIEPVPDCGHFVPWEAPDAVNAAMEAFLAR